MKNSLRAILISAAVVFGACKKDKETSNRCSLPSSDWNYSGAVMFDGKKVNFSNLTVQLDTTNAVHTIGFGMFKNNGPGEIEFFLSPMSIGDTVLVGEDVNASATALIEYTCTDTYNFNNNCVMWPPTLSKGFAEKVSDNKYKVSFSTIFKVDVIEGQTQSACRIGNSRYSEMTVEVDIVLTPPL